MVIFFHVIDIERRLCERHNIYFLLVKRHEFYYVLFCFFIASATRFLVICFWYGGRRTRCTTAVIHIVRRPSYKLYDEHRTLIFLTSSF